MILYINRQNWVTIPKILSEKVNPNNGFDNGKTRTNESIQQAN